MDYCAWKKNIIQHFDHTEQLDESAYIPRFNRLKDAIDESWIHHLDQQIKANKINSWKDIVAEIEKKMDDIFPMLKLKQQKSENLHAFITRIDIARQTLD